MDFYDIKEVQRVTKRGTTIDVFPDFKVGRSKDLMVKGRSFHAIWDEEKELWSTDEYDVQRLVDKELMDYRNKLAEKTDDPINVKLTSQFSNNVWLQYRNLLNHIPDSSKELDNKIVFSNTEIKKKDYITKKLPYPLEEGKCDAYEEIISTLYDPEERLKIEWAIGAIISGDAKNIQKFIVLYGESGGGKSTMLNIIQKLFEGYYTSFEAKALTSINSPFALEVFRTNPLVAIQHDGDLSKIEDNTRLNSIVSHEYMTMNEKYKSSYSTRFNCFLFMGTNKPVKISDAKSGLTRRLIDVNTSGRKLTPNRYYSLVSQIDFELGAIAYRCLNIYQGLGKNHYSKYLPLDMMFRTDMFFNFVEENYHIFKEQDGTTIAQAYAMFKEYCTDSSLTSQLPRYKFRDELKNYFEEFHDVTRVDGKQVRSYYSGFLASKFVSSGGVVKEETISWLVLDRTKSIFDDSFGDLPAQYGNEEEIPYKKWEKVKTKLSDLDTRKLHYVRVPPNHIVIDFDLKDKDGEKSLAKNMAAASQWPTTYAEFSKSERGIHLHYIYDGDVDCLVNIFEPGVEVKVFNGLSSLRRKLSKCNTIGIRTITSGIPLKEKAVINVDGVKSEKALRELIMRNLRKEIHPSTKPSMDFINTIFEEAYASGLHYDLTDMRPKILSFASNSTNQAGYCIKLASNMKFQSDEISKGDPYSSDDLVFFDVEVFPNLLLVNWKYAGDDKVCVHMINPSSQEIESLVKMKLVGFNNRRYDNHILYARYIGYDNEQIYTLSQRIIGDSKNALFGEAYNLSYTDVYDFSSAGNKKSLKKWEIELGLHHQELGLPWDQPVPQDQWIQVSEYCDNDVISTEKVFDYLAGDWAARQIISELSGLTVNDTTNSHSTKIMFGDNKKPQSEFVYTDLSKMFPGYKYDAGKSTYRGEETGEGGYIYAEPGMYKNVVLLDVASMHPTSIEQLNLFGPYTERFSQIKNARIAIKRNDRATLFKLLNGRLKPFIERADAGEFKLTDLSNALKTVINSIYGLTSATFENPFRDVRNRDNIVAKRGALFMVDLKHAVQEQGFTVCHIKTDSIKIPDATPEIIEFVMRFGVNYGYDFENEGTFDKFCLANDAVYIAHHKDGRDAGKWTATGAQFAQPYVFKTIFSGEPIVFTDMCETKSVSTSLWLDMNEGMGTDEHNYKFVGKVGSFCPVKKGKGGGTLLREKEGKYYAASGTKGYRWLEAETVAILQKEQDIDRSFYDNLVKEAIEDISKFGDFTWFAG